MKLQVGVKALIQNDQGQYLMLHRAETTANETKAHWDIPGGRIEPDEALLDALKREIHEETGLTVESAPELLGAQDIFVPPAGLHVVRLTYILKGDGEVVISHEHQGTRWVTRKEALKLRLDPYLRSILENQKAPNE